MTTRFIRIKEVINQTGFSKSHIYTLARKGLFPKPVRLSESSVAWLESEVHEWMQTRIDARQGADHVAS